MESSIRRIVVAASVASLSDFVLILVGSKTPKSFIELSFKQFDLTSFFLVSDTALVQVKATIFKVCPLLVDLGLIVEGSQLNIS